MRKPTETALVNACLQLLHAHGIEAWRQNTGAVKVGTRFVRFGRPGAADITGILDGGRRLEIECKVGRNKLSEAQEEFRDMIEARGGVYLCVREVEELERWCRGET
jgi:hypothetical protein